MSKILVTGCAGFIGSNLVDRLVEESYEIIGIDNFNDYYDKKIKERNLIKVLKSANFKLYKQDILEFEKLKKVFEIEKVDKVVHLAARAGVRPSIEDPLLYSRVNVLGTVNILKLCVKHQIKQLIFSSSSSVYGQSKKMPFAEDNECNDIISPYGSSKRSAEFWIESYSKSFNLKSIILRFFTVYGPRGRPDMAPFLFTKAISQGKIIDQFGDGKSSRDYTYVGDILTGISKALNKNLDFEIFNLGNNHPVELSEFIATLEKLTGKAAKISKSATRIGDVTSTWADISKSKRLLDWEPKIKLEEGLKRYLDS